MLFYNNGRFSLGGVSFKLPNGMHVDTACDEICGQGFALISPDGSFRMMIDGRSGYADAYSMIHHNFEGDHTLCLSGAIEAIEANEIKGYKASYQSNDLGMRNMYLICKVAENTLFWTYTLSRKQVNPAMKHSKITLWKIH